MEVVFKRTGERRYAIEVCRGPGDVLVMDPAPGFDDYVPHDPAHLVVEEQLGLSNGIFGRLAKGGTASTFSPQRRDSGPAKRGVARRRRKLQQRERHLSEAEPPDFGRSERATFVVWHDWLASCPEPALRRTGAAMAETAAAILDRMATVERAELVAALPR